MSGKSPKALNINITDCDITMGTSTIHKLLFLSNALDNGWCIKKQKDRYVFKKKHENKEEVFQENYLEEFLLENGSLKNVWSS